MRFLSIAISLSALLAFGCRPTQPPTVPAQTMPEAVVPAPVAPPTPSPLQAQLSCDGPGCELTVDFNHPMVELNGMATAPVPELLLEPALEGALRWDTPTRLRFTPSTPLKLGDVVTVSLATARALDPQVPPLTDWEWELEVSERYIAGKVVEWPVKRGLPRVVTPLTVGDGIGPSGLLLVFDQKVAPGALKLSATSKGKKVDLTLSRPDTVEPLYSDELDLDLVVRAQLSSLPPHGAEVIFSLPSWEEGDKGKVTATTQERSFTVVRNFQVTADGGGDANAQRMPLQSTISFAASHAMPGHQLDQWVQVEPAPMSRHVEHYGEGFELTLTMEPATEYTVKVVGATDYFGNQSQPTTMKFRTRDLPPQLEAPTLPVVVETHSPRLPLRLLNVGQVEAKLHRFDSAQEFIAAYRQKQRACVGTVEKAITSKAAAPLNQKEQRDLSLPPKAGLYCVQLQGEGRGTEASPRTARALAQVSNLASTVKTAPGELVVWATRLHEATVVEGAKVEVLKGSGQVVASGTTDPLGLARLSLPGMVTGEGVREPLFVTVRHQEDVAITEVEEQRLSRPWQFGLAGTNSAVLPLYAALFTDRGVYRPGDTVHLKAIVPAQGNVQLKVTDARGQTVLEKSMALDELGGTHTEVKLSEKAAVGEYSVRLTHQKQVATRSFRVEEYRVPTFAVKVKENEHHPYATVEAHYLHGSPLSGRQVKWELYQEQENFAPPQFPGFRFHEENERDGDGLVQSGQEKLDGHGQLSVPLQLSGAGLPTPVRYTLEATVTDVDRQSWTGRWSKLVHPTAFYLGVRPPSRAVLEQGEWLEVPVVAVAPEGTPRAGVKVEVEVSRIDHHSSVRVSNDQGELTSQPVETEVTRCEVTTTATATTCRIRLQQAGRYRLTASAREGAKKVSTGLVFTVAGANKVAWPRFDKERIEVVADKKQYRVGEVAKLVVATPFEKARGLLTLEREGLLTQRVFEIRKNTPAIEIPITEDMVPNVFASVVLLRGREHSQKDALGFETGAPAFKLGYVALKVDPSARRLQVQVTPDSKVAAPRQNVRLEISAQQPDGRAAVGQVTVAVVDEAVLGLTGFKTPDPLAQLYASRPLSVRTADGRLDLVHARRARQEELFPGGDGGDGFGLRILPDELRNLFQSTAYWNPRVPLGPDGKAVVNVPLPDNLTTFRVMVVANDAQFRAGSADTRLTVRKPLMVQPVLPRFAYPGDRFVVEAFAFNGTAQQGTIQVSAMGLEGLSAPKGAPLTFSHPVASGASVKVGIPVEVTGRGEMKVRLRAQLGKETDEVEVKIPILDAGAQRVVVASTQVGQQGSVEIPLPKERVPGSTEVEVLVSSSALTELKDAVQYLMRYPNGCLEQTTSTAYPLVVLKYLLPEMGVTVSEADLKKFSEAGIKRLLSFQTTSGGLAYWPGSDKPHVFGTTFGLTALLEGKKRGFEVPDESLARMASYLEQQLREGTISEEMPHGGMPDADTRALMVLTLNRMKRPQPSYVSTLWQQKEKLSAFGMAMLAVTVSEGGGEKALLEPMLAEVRQKAEENSAEAWYEAPRKGGWSMDSPLRTHAASLLAFSSEGVRSDVTPKLLSGLLKRKTGYGIWGNTQENVYGVMAVAKLVGSGKGSAPDAALTLGGRPVKLEQMEKVADRVRRFSSGGKELGLSESQPATATAELVRQGGPPTFLTLRARYELPLTPENRGAVSQGFSIRRQYETLEGKPLEGKIPLGAVVRVRLSVKNEAKQNYVAVADLLPAGLEPLNAHLATTERMSMGPATPTVQQGLSVLSFQETRDARVAFYADELPSGEYEWVYLARATTPGKFLRPAASVEAMYEEEKHGRSPIDEVEVVPVKATGRRPSGVAR